MVVSKKINNTLRTDLNAMKNCINKINLHCLCFNEQTLICKRNKPMPEIMYVTKSNGTRVEFSWEKIEKFYKRVCHGLNTKCPYSKLKENLERYVVDWISTKSINEVIIKSAINLISPENIQWQFIAGRMMIKNLYKEFERATWIPSHEVYGAEYLNDLIHNYTEKELYNRRLLETYSEEDILELGEYIDGNYDFNYNHGTVLTYEKRYLLNRNNEMRELPQHMYMVNAMFLWIPEEEENRIEFVKNLYDMTAIWEISLPTPTLLNARTPNSQLSSCFILTPADDLRSIYHNVEEMAVISKNGWGLWVYMGNIRSRGGTIKGVYWLSGGVTPWIKVINDTAIAVNQMGKRAGAISVTLDIFHRDIHQFLDLQTETGDIRGKSFDIFPAVSFPDIFFRRMENDEPFTLFCPKEVEDKYGKRLQDHFWEEFDEFYEELEQDPELKLKTVTTAKDLFKTYLKSVVETGMPYSFYRDTVNKLNPNKHAGNIYCTNLCTEIAQNQSENTFIVEEEEDWVITTKHQSGDTVICNLASINVAKVHLPADVARVVPIAMRTLDNVIELNAYPLQEARISAQKYRAVGLGMMGLAQYFAENKLMYGSPESVEATDVLFKNLAYETLRSSVDLAKERWAYPAFPWSEYSKGKAFGKQIRDFEELDWDYIHDNLLKQHWMWHTLERDMMTHWTRFWYHSSPAPNTSTWLVVGTTAGLVPVYRKYFVETNAIAPTVNVAPNLNEENFWYYPEYTSMKLDTVIDVFATAQKWIDQSVSFERMINPAKTSPKDLYGYFLKGWKAWLKTVYYVRSQSSEVDECVSCSG